MQKLLAIEMGYKNAILLIMDIPYLAKNEYSVVEGIARGNSKKARKAAESRTVMIQTEEKEEIAIRLRINL